MKTMSKSSATTIQERYIISSSPERDEQEEVKRASLLLPYT
jgi:hypothetical protein